MSQGLIGQSKWTRAHKEKNPTGEAQRKAVQRQREDVARFHIVRNHRYGYEIPETVDQDSEVFKRVRAEYLKTAAEPVEVVETVG